MNCSDYRLLIPFRRTGDLLPEDAERLDAHLETCSACTSLATPSPADAVIQNAFQSVIVPSGLKDRVGRAVAMERRAMAIRRVGRFGLISSILALMGFASWGVYGLTRPKLDTETIGIWNGYEADAGQVKNLVYTWLEQDEKLSTDLPFDFEFKYFVSRGYERFGGYEKFDRNAFVPVLKFQNQSALSSVGSFAKVYFIRNSEVNIKAAIDAQSSSCTVCVIPGENGMTYLLVHTGKDSLPFVRLARNRID